MMGLGGGGQHWEVTGHEGKVLMKEMSELIKQSQR